MRKRKIREERGITFTRGEVERRARGMVSAIDEDFYQAKRHEFLQSRGEMLMTLVMQGRVLSEMRERSRAFLVRIAQETGDAEDRLENLADFWEYFREELPRTDINPAYYLYVSRAIKVIKATWKDEPEVGEGAIEASREFLERLEPAEQGPRVLADHLLERFGIIEPGNKPFAGLAIASSTLEDIERYAAERFHELVQPYFVEFARRLREKQVALPTAEETKISPQVEEREEAKTTLLYFTFKSQGELDKDALEKLVGLIRQTFEKEGLSCEVVRAQAYPQK